MMKNSFVSAILILGFVAAVIEGQSSVCVCPGNQRIVTSFSAPGVPNVDKKVFGIMKRDYTETPDIYEKFLDIRVMKAGEHTYELDEQNQCFYSTIGGARLGFGNRVANGVQVTMIGETKGDTFVNTICGCKDDKSGFCQVLTMKVVERLNNIKCVLEGTNPEQCPRPRFDFN